MSRWKLEIAGTNQWVLRVGTWHPGFSSDVPKTACLPPPVPTGRDYKTMTVPDNGVRQIIEERIRESRDQIPSASEYRTTDHHKNNGMVGALGWAVLSNPQCLVPSATPVLLVVIRSWTVA